MLAIAYQKKRPEKGASTIASSKIDTMCVIRHPELFANRTFDRTVPYRTVLYRTVLYRTLQLGFLNRTVPYRTLQLGFLNRTVPYRTLQIPRTVLLQSTVRCVLKYN